MISYPAAQEATPRCVAANVVLVVISLGACTPPTGHFNLAIDAPRDTRVISQSALEAAPNLGCSGIIAKMTADLEAYVDSQNANTPWRYYNYVNQNQHPLESYGADNVRFLKAVAAKYDPAGVFQTRVPGGFKLSNIQ